MNEISIWNWTILFLVVFIFLGLLVFLFRIKRGKTDNQYNPYGAMSGNHVPESIDNNIENRTATDKDKRLLIAMALGVAIFVVVLSFFSFGSGGEDNKKDSFSMVPIWIAIFVPLIANKHKQQRKNKEDLQQQTLRKLIILFVIGMVMAMTMIFIFLAKNL